MLKTEPKARYVLKVCNSTPCHFSRSEEIAQILKEELGVGIGETTEDGVFAYHYIPCVGACDIGPVSYTHLDVYKRQHQRNAFFLGLFKQTFKPTLHLWVVKVICLFNTQTKRQIRWP